MEHSDYNELLEMFSKLVGSHGRPRRLRRPRLSYEARVARNRERYNRFSNDPNYIMSGGVDSWIAYPKNSAEGKKFIEEQKLEEQRIEREKFKSENPAEYLFELIYKIMPASREKISRVEIRKMMLDCSVPFTPEIFAEIIELLEEEDFEIN